MQVHQVLRVAWRRPLRGRRGDHTGQVRAALLQRLLGEQPGLMDVRSLFVLQEPGPP